MALKDDFAEGQQRPEMILRHILAGFIFCQRMAIDLEKRSSADLEAKAAYLHADAFLKVANEQ